MYIVWFLRKSLGQCGAECKMYCSACQQALAEGELPVRRSRGVSYRRRAGHPLQSRLPRHPHTPSMRRRKFSDPWLFRFSLEMDKQFETEAERIEEAK